MAARAGVIGIGAMGMGVAKRLLEQRYEVHVRDVRPEADARAREAGAVVCASPEAAAPRLAPHLRHRAAVVCRHQRRGARAGGRCGAGEVLRRGGRGHAAGRRERRALTMARTELDDAQSNAPSSVFSGLELGMPKSPSAEGVVFTTSRREDDPSADQVLFHDPAL